MDELESLVGPQLNSIVREINLAIPASANPRADSFLPGYKVISLSCSKNTAVIDFCAKTLALELMEDFRFETLFHRKLCISESIP